MSTDKNTPDLTTIPAPDEEPRYATVVVTIAGEEVHRKSICLPPGVTPTVEQVWQMSSPYALSPTELRRGRPSPPLTRAMVEELGVSVETARAEGWEVED